MADITGTLSMCRRAAKLICGTDEVKSACQRKTAFLVLTASDFSEKSKKEISRVCLREKIPLLTIAETMDDIGGAIGKRFGVMAVTDKGFAGAITKKLNQ